jgi:hypothetical protein
MRDRDLRCKSLGQVLARRSGRLRKLTSPKAGANSFSNQVDGSMER